MTWPGRLGLLDSVELWPPFSWPPERALAILAGGNDAIFREIEGAVSRIQVQGARYPEELQKLVGR